MYVGKRYYKKVTADDIFVKCVDENNNYSIASKNDPEPEGYTHSAWYDQMKEDSRNAGWKQISVEEASKILGYDVTE